MAPSPSKSAAVTTRRSLTDVPVDHMPTCAAFICRFDVKHWHDVSLSTGDYVALEHP